MKQSAKQDARAITRAERKQQALEYRKQGLTYAVIAEKLGVVPQTAHNYVHEEMRRLAEENLTTAEEMRELISQRNDMAREGLWPKVQAGSPAAVTAWIKLNQEDAKLWGAYAPERHDTRLLTIDLNEMVAALQRARVAIDDPDD